MLDPRAIIERVRRHMRREIVIRPGGSRGWFWMRSKMQRAAPWKASIVNFYVFWNWSNLIWIIIIILSS